MKLNAAKKKYRNEWIGFQFTNQKKNEGKVLFHTKRKDSVFALLEKNEPRPENVYITFAGPVVPRGVSLLLGPFL